MSPEIKKLIQNRYAELPTLLQKILASDDFPETIAHIAAKYRLPSEVGPKLENEVALILLGFEKRDDLRETIEQELLIPGDVADLMAQDITEEIFEPVHATIDTFYEQFTETNEEEADNEQQRSKSVAQEVSRERENMLKQDSAGEGEVAAPADVPKEKQKENESSEPSTPEAPADLEEQKLNTPRYRQPLTNTPKYGGADPYREPPTP